ncbi:MAG: penicillin acylase family protein [Chloroflexi bacterium]|nr:penicillin acylase family protein [Chloroflexota bacterium]
MALLRLLSVLIGLLLLLPVSIAASAQAERGHYRQFGDAGGFLNILPPGQDGVLNGLEALAAQAGQYPPHVRDQLGMYGDLVYNTPGLREDELGAYFKDASFFVREDDIDRVYSPTTDVIVVRDKSFGVAHIFGQTRYATMFAQGYTGAEDRLFLMDVLRHVGRARLSEFLGASPANEQLDREQLAIAPYTETDLSDQLQQAIAASGAEGQAIYGDLLAYVDGVNQYIEEALADPSKLPAEYPALQQVPLPWKAEDTVAIASLVGGIFGKGGGGELSNLCGLKLLGDATGNAAQARAIFDDLHFANDREAPTTSHRLAPYMTDLGPVDPAAHPEVDCSTLKPIDDGQTSLEDLLAAISGSAGVVAGRGGTHAAGVHTVDAPWGQFQLDFSQEMSNALLVSGKRTKTGNPIAVFGPQTAYFIPQLLVEKDVHGPGVDARGAAFAGTDLYVQLGRGPNFAWSATSSGADNIDQWVLSLCEPGGGQATPQSMGYLRNGLCEPIEAFQHTQVAKPSAGGVPAAPDVILSWRVERTQHYGPLVARGTLADGTPIAVASLRSTYRNELGSARAFYRINNPDYMANGFDSFRTAISTGVDYTFNWFYIDDHDIGYQHSCKCPQRARGVDPYLPVSGTGQWDWRGYIPPSAQPWDLNPPKGYITSWNNKQAPGFMANDREFSYGPTYRDQMLNIRIEAAIAAGKIDRAALVDAMEDAGTVDLRGQEDLPLLLQALGPTAPAGVDPRAQEMRDRLAGWAAAGAHRRDYDHDGQYDDPQSPAIMDAWWPRLARAIFDDTSLGALDKLGIELDDGNRLIHRGSAFQDGVYGHVNKDLRQVLRLPVEDPWSRTYCGGSLAACRSALWQSLGQAAADLAAEFGTANVADWRRQMSYEDVRHSPVGVTTVPAIHWINRPTFQQVVQIDMPEVVARSSGAGSLSRADGKKIGFTYGVQAYAGGGGQGEFRLTDAAGKHKIDVEQIVSAGSPAAGPCGVVPAGAPHSFEFTGSGTFDSASGVTVHVCVQDTADPGKGVDLMHVDCAGCPYTTSPPATSEVLSGGNLKVSLLAAPESR